MTRSWVPGRNVRTVTDDLSRPLPRSVVSIVPSRSISCWNRRRTSQRHEKATGLPGVRSRNLETQTRHAPAKDKYRPVSGPRKTHKNDITSTEPVLSVTRAVKEMFTKAVEYRQYRLITTSKRYDDDVANELHNTAETTTVQSKDKTFSRKYSM